MAKKIGSLLLFSVIILTVYVSAVVPPRTLDVCSSGCNYSTIQSAINDANSFDKIIVSNETYFEHIVIDKSLIIIGDKNTKSIIDCQGNSIGVSINSNNSIFEFFDIKNCNIGLQINGEKNQIYNNSIHDNSNYGIDINFPDNKIINNKIFSNNIGINLMKSSSIIINYNEINSNSLYEIKNSDTGSINAKFNWWGDCNGPGTKANGNVDYSNWLGVCISNLRESLSCVIATDSVNLLATITSQSCIGKVIFQVKKSGGDYENITGLKTLGGDYMVVLSELPSSSNVYWKVYAEDCNKYNELSSIESFYTNAKTKLTVAPINPNGENNWYISKPILMLENPDAGQIYYRWDSSDTHNYIGPFSIDQAPNNANVSGGILDINFYSDKCNEKTQKVILKIDINPPIVKNMVPKNNEEVLTDKPLISADLDEIYNGDSGVNKSSVIMKLDNVIVNPNVKTDLSKNVDAILSYNPEEILSFGNHEVYIYLKDNAGNENEKTWNFIVAEPSDYNITIYDPIDNSRYSEKRINFNLTTTRIVETLEYINNNDKKPRYTLLCKKCSDYGNSIKRIKSLNEGKNEIIFRATDKFGMVKEKIVNVEIKSTKPKISSTLPKKDSVVNGSSFSAKYSESSIKSLILYLNSSSNSTMKELLNCLSGDNKICETSLDLSEYNGLTLEYYFILKDIIDNEAISKKVKINVDTQGPTLTINSPIDLSTSGRNVRINLSVSEKVTLMYMDNSDARPKWTKLCTSCDSYGYTKKSTKSFFSGFHQVTFKASDKAGNTDIKTVSFIVN